MLFTATFENGLLYFLNCNNFPTLLHKRQDIINELIEKFKKIFVAVLLRVAIWRYHPTSRCWTGTKQWIIVWCSTPRCMDCGSRKGPIRRELSACSGSGTEYGIPILMFLKLRFGVTCSTRSNSIRSSKSKLFEAFKSCTNSLCWNIHILS